MLDVHSNYWWKGVGRMLILAYISFAMNKLFFPTCITCAISLVQQPLFIPLTWTVMHSCGLFEWSFLVFGKGGGGGRGG